MTKFGPFLLLLWITSAFSGLAAQDAGSELRVEPSGRIRFPQASDLLNVTPDAPPARPAPAPQAPPPLPAGDLSGSVRSAPGEALVLNGNQRPETGWYIQFRLGPGQVETYSELLNRVLEAFTGRGVFVRLVGPEWRALVGPLQAGELSRVLERARALGLREAVLRREV